MKLKKKQWWTIEEVYPCKTHNDGYDTYVAKIEGIDNKGEEIRSYLRMSVIQNLFYDVSTLRYGDIIVASNYNKAKRKQDKRYYVVLDNTEREIVLRGGDKDGIYNTYDKAQMFLSSNKADIGETVKTYELFD